MGESNQSQRNKRRTDKASKNGFARCTWPILTAEIPDGAFRLYLYLLFRRDAKTGLCWPSVQRIADDLKKKPRQIFERLRVLLEAGWITKKRGDSGGHANTYTVVEPPPTNVRFSAYLRRVPNARKSAAPNARKTATQPYPREPEPSPSALSAQSSSDLIRVPSPNRRELGTAGRVEVTNDKRKHIEPDDENPRHEPQRGFRTTEALSGIAGGIA